MTETSIVETVEKMDLKSVAVFVLLIWSTMATFGFEGSFWFVDLEISSRLIGIFCLLLLSLRVRDEER